MSQQDFLTLEEAAKALKKSVQTLRRMIKRGELPAQRVRTPQGFNYVIKKEDALSAEDVAVAVPEVPKVVLSNSPIQNPVFAQEQESIQVLTSRNEILTSQSELKPLLDNAFYTIDRNMTPTLMKVIELQHKEQMRLIAILEKMQVELQRREEKPRSFLDRIVDWFFE